MHFKNDVFSMQRRTCISSFVIFIIPWRFHHLDSFLSKKQKLLQVPKFSTDFRFLHWNFLLETEQTCKLKLARKLSDALHHIFFRVIEASVFNRFSYEKKRYENAWKYLKLQISYGHETRFLFVSV